MRAETLENLRLLCPVCRTAELRIGTVDLVDTEGELMQGSLLCRGVSCGRVHPIIDGVGILVDDWISYARSERWMILRRRDLPDWLERALDAPLGDDHAERIRQRHLETYQRAHRHEAHTELRSLEGRFHEFLDRALSEHGPAQAAGRQRIGLDAGCAAGGWTAQMSEHVDLAVGIDLHFERVRAAREEHRRPNMAFLVANGEEPPFPQDTFDVVLALNLVDAIARPGVTLRNLDACLRPGGLLMLSTPFEYSSVYSAPQERIGEEELMRWINSGYEVLMDAERLPWVLPVSDRRSDVFFVRALCARKKREADPPRARKRTVGRTPQKP